MATDEEKRRMAGQMGRSNQRPGALQDLLKNATLRRTVGYQTRQRPGARQPGAQQVVEPGLSAMVPRGPRIPNQPLVDNDAVAAAAGGLSSALGPESPMAPNPPMRRYGDSTVYANEKPGSGYGKAAYSDSPGGLNSFKGGNYAAAQGFGPFGRTEANQQAIENRVGQYKRAIDLIREIRGWGQPSERERLQGRANQRISLNQGLGAFVNQVSDRNYAREQLGTMDEREAEQAQLAAKQQQQLFDNQLGLARLAADRFQFKTVDSVDPNTLQPTQQAYQFDAMTGTSRPMNLGQGSDLMSMVNPENLEYTAKLHNISVDELKKRLGVE